MISRILCTFGFHKGIYDLGTLWSTTLTSKDGTVRVTEYIKQKRVCLECRKIEFSKVVVKEKVIPSWDKDRGEDDSD